MDLRSERTAFERRGYQLLMEGAIEGVAEFAYYDEPDLCAIVEPLQLSPRLPLFLARHARVYRG